MERQIIIKSLNPSYVREELENIGFDSSYLPHAVEKNDTKTLKILNLLPQEASILKQSALALGFDAAVSRGVLDCSVETSDAILTGSVVQLKKLSESLLVQPFKMKQVGSLIKSNIEKTCMPMDINGLVFDWSRPYIMGILNITPDSFSDGGKYFSVEAAVEHYNEMIMDGADIIDIGAESTRPGHCVISSEEEIKRLKPILKELRLQNSQIPISVDTRNVKTAQMAVDMGANIINDVGFGSTNFDMIEFVNANAVPYIYMHNEIPLEPMIDSIYTKILEVLAKINTAAIVDLGIGFGKNIEQCYKLISRAEEFKSLKVPIMVGHSRKSFLSKAFDYNIDELNEATLVLSAKLVMSGINILRVHDVLSHKRMIRLLDKLY